MGIATLPAEGRFLLMEDLMLNLSNVNSAYTGYFIEGDLHSYDFTRLNADECGVLFKWNDGKAHEAAMAQTAFALFGALEEF